MQFNAGHMFGLCQQYIGMIFRVESLPVNVDFVAIQIGKDFGYYRMYLRMIVAFVIVIAFVVLVFVFMFAFIFVLVFIVIFVLVPVKIVTPAAIIAGVGGPGRLPVYRQARQSNKKNSKHPIKSSHAVLSVYRNRTGRAHPGQGQPSNDLKLGATVKYRYKLVYM
jgi:hypothetical protein